MNQCDIEKCDQSESEHSASLDSESSDSNESHSSVHHHLPNPPSRCHLPRSLQLALVQVGASGEQVACGGQGDSLTRAELRTRRRRGQ